MGSFHSSGFVQNHSWSACRSFGTQTQGNTLEKRGGGGNEVNMFRISRRRFVSLAILSPRGGEFLGSDTKDSRIEE